ncbi:MAG: TPM domain-containing protein [Candidatus Baltobacteraceae bacterium]
MTREERATIAHAITGAEEGTTGWIAVRVIPDRSVDAFERAKREFERVGLHRHPHANAALILVAPNARGFAVIGGRALHECVGDPFWQSVVDESRPYFARGAVSDGIVHAVGRLGEAFQAHFQQTDGESAE